MTAELPDHKVHMTDEKTFWTNPSADNKNRPNRIYWHRKSRRLQHVLCCSIVPTVLHIVRKSQDQCCINYLLPNMLEVCHDLLENNAVFRKKQRANTHVRDNTTLAWRGWRAFLGLQWQILLAEKQSTFNVTKTHWINVRVALCLNKVV